jgi:hypothetical protein
MARVTIRIDNAPFEREAAALKRRIAASPRIHDAVLALAEQGVGMVEVIPAPPGAKSVRLRAQLSQPYWAILEREAA